MNGKESIASSAEVQCTEMVRKMYLLPISEKQIIMIANKKTKWWITLCVLAMLCCSIKTNIFTTVPVSSLSSLSSQLLLLPLARREETEDKRYGVLTLVCSLCWWCYLRELIFHFRYSIAICHSFVRCFL